MSNSNYVDKVVLSVEDFDSWTVGRWTPDSIPDNGDYSIDFSNSLISFERVLMGFDPINKEFALDKLDASKLISVLNKIIDKGGLPPSMRVMDSSRNYKMTVYDDDGFDICKLEWNNHDAENSADPDSKELFMIVDSILSKINAKR